MSHAPRPSFAIGDVVAGRYRIERLLGQGGMGIVAAARHLELDEVFALKVMVLDSAATPDWIERFMREARMAAKLKSVHAAKVVDSGRLADGAPYLVMEYLQGRDLSHELHVRRVLPPAEAAAYIMQACDVLTEAHALGIVHRDLKPANLFLTRLPNGAPCIKVLDFGIAKQTDPLNAPRMTQTATVFGTPLYMSPEQMKSAKSVDPRSDIWALGVVLYELCTGTVPYDGESITALVAQVMTELPVPPSQRRHGIGPEMERVILTCLERDPARRFPSAAALAQALAPIVSGMSGGRPSMASYHDIANPLTGSGQYMIVSAPGQVLTGQAVDPRTSPQFANDGTQRAMTASSVRTVSSRTGLFAVLAAFALGVGAIAAFFALRSGSDAQTPAAPQNVTEPLTAAPAVSSAPAIAPATVVPAEPPAPASAAPSVTAAPPSPATAAKPSSTSSKQSPPKPSTKPSATGKPPPRGGFL